MAGANVRRIDPDTAAITGEPFFQSRIEAEDMPALVTGYNRDPEAGDRQRIKVGLRC